jgi:hypothetical protein
MQEFGEFSEKVRLRNCVTLAVLCCVSGRGVGDNTTTTTTTNNNNIDDNSNTSRTEEGTHELDYFSKEAAEAIT